jgi:hypothetical protein
MPVSKSFTTYSRESFKQLFIKTLAVCVCVNIGIRVCALESALDPMHLAFCFSLWLEILLICAMSVLVTFVVQCMHCFLDWISCVRNLNAYL